MASKAKSAAQQTATAPRRYITREQAAIEFQNRYGVPISARTFERWPLAWVIINGRAATDEQGFFELAERRINAAAVIRGGLVTKAA